MPKVQTTRGPGSLEYGVEVPTIPEIGEVMTYPLKYP